MSTASTYNKESRASAEKLDRRNATAGHSTPDRTKAKTAASSAWTPNLPGSTATLTSTGTGAPPPTSNSREDAEPQASPSKKTRTEQQSAPAEGKSASMDVSADSDAKLAQGPAPDALVVHDRHQRTPRV
jgi:hypothetical protein